MFGLTVPAAIVICVPLGQKGPKFSGVDGGQIAGQLHAGFILRGGIRIHELTPLLDNAFDFTDQDQAPKRCDCQP